MRGVIATLVLVAPMGVGSKGRVHASFHRDRMPAEGPVAVINRWPGRR
jgi:hypothetical protein